MVKHTLEFFTSHAYNTESPHHVDCLAKLSSLLTDLLALPISPLKTPGMTSGKSWASVVIAHSEFINHCSADLSKTLLTSNAIFESLNTLQEAATQSTDKENILKLSAYESLIAHATFMSSVDSDLSHIIADLHDCFKRLFHKLPTNKRKSEPSDELNPHDVLLDILINFMSKPSTLLRSVAENTFKVFCGGVTRHGLDLIFEVLEGKVDENMNEDSEDESGSDIASDTENQSEEISDEEEDDDEDEISKLKSLISESIPDMLPESGSESEGEFLGDDDMAIFDDKLVEIFKQRKEMKQAKKTNKDLVMHFKARLLDFVEIFIKRQGSNPLLLSMVVPLLRLSLKSSSEFQLHEKLNTILKNKLAKLKETPTVSIEAGLEMLSEIHAIASRSSEQAFMLMCTGLCKLVTRSILSNANVESAPPRKKKSKTSTSNVEMILLPSKEEQICAIYEKSIVSKMTKKQSQLTSAFFSDYIKSFPTLSLPICTIVVKELRMETVSNGFQLVEGAKIIQSMVMTLSKPVKQPTFYFNYRII